MKKRLAPYLDPNDTLERRGLILTRGRVIECQNIAEDPERGFEIPPDDLVKYEKELTGTWHTHPGESSGLSLKDTYGFLAWPKLRHFIIGTDGVSEYRVEDGI